LPAFFPVAFCQYEHLIFHGRPPSTMPSLTPPQHAGCGRKGPSPNGRNQA
jgi:hypothetical protein